MRAFLSYSHADKALIDQIARHLTRQFCIYDTGEFATGEEFRDAIRQALARSSIYVLFFSSSAKNSTWISFEQNEAELLQISGLIKRAIVFLVGEHVSVDDVFLWLRRRLVKRLAEPKLIAREIYNPIIQHARTQHHDLFMGRSTERQEAQRVLVPTDGRPPPVYFMFTDCQE